MDTLKEVLEKYDLTLVSVTPGPNPGDLEAALVESIERAMHPVLGLAGRLRGEAGGYRDSAMCTRLGSIFSEEEIPPKLKYKAERYDRTAKLLVEAANMIEELHENNSSK